MQKPYPRIPGGQPLDNLDRGIVGVAIDHDDLKLISRIILALNEADSRRDEFLLVANRNHYRLFW